MYLYAMAKAIKIEIKESIPELKRMISNQKSILKKSRIKCLLLIKEKSIHFKTVLSKKLKYDRNAIAGWLKDYEQGGIELLLNDKRSLIKRKSKLSKKTLESIGEKLQQIDTDLTSYVELLDWVQNNFEEKDLAYSTLYYNCRKHFKSRLKVSRKTHHKKDVEAETLFKKPS